MQVFKAFLLVLRSRWYVTLIYVALFFAVGLMMTYMDNGTQVWEQSSMNLMIVDNDDTPESRAIREFLSANNKMIDPIEDEDRLMDALYFGEVDYALTIPKGFAERLRAGETENLLESKHMHESYSVANIRMLLSEYVNTVSAYRAMGRTAQEASDATVKILLRKIDVTIAKEDAKSGILKSNSALYFRFLPYILLSVILMSLTPSLTAINAKEIRYRTDCSGIRPSSYTGQVFAASIIYVLVIAVVFIATGMFINGGIFTGKCWIAALNCLLCALFSAALAMFLAEFDPSNNASNALTVIIALGMSFLCGVFVAQEFLGSGVLATARFLPVYWYVLITRMLGGEIPYNSGDVMMALLIQAAYIAVFFLLSMIARHARYAGSPVRKRQTA